MPVGKVEVGTSWAHLICVEDGSEDREFKDSGGLVYEIWQNQKYLVLRCDCGQTLRMWAEEFKGKRGLKDCGCGAGDNDSLLVNMCFTVQYNLRAEVVAYQKQHNLTLSAAIRALLKAGLDSK